MHLNGFLTWVELCAAPYWGVTTLIDQHENLAQSNISVCVSGSCRQLADNATFWNDATYCIWALVKVYISTMQGERFIM